MLDLERRRTASVVAGVARPVEDARLVIAVARDERRLVSLKRPPNVVVGSFRISQVVEVHRLVAGRAAGSRDGRSEQRCRQKLLHAPTHIHALSLTAS